MPLTSGILSVTSANANSISLSATAASGGTAPYTYQWYSSPGGTGFVANLSTIISGATGLSLTAVGLFASVTYGFQLISTDATGLTVFSTQLGASTTAIGEAVLGPNANSKSDSELSKFFLTAGGQTAVRVVNPDGTSIAGGGGGSTTVNAHAAPQSFVEGTNNPFQGDLQGALKVNVVAGSGGGGTSSTFGANLPTVGTATGFVDQNGKMQSASVAAFHAGDNTNVSAGGLGLLTGGVTQIKNAQGGLDRQTEAGLDNVSALGITTGISSFSVPFTFTVAAAITASTSSQVVTPSSMANIYVGTVLNFDTGTPTVTEPVIVVSFTATTFNGVFTKSHAAGVSAKAFYYNQARDGAIGDSVPVAGLSAGMTYFINSINGLAEQERSAAGELDGASGRGTAVAAEYEYNSGGPITSTGSVSNLNFDRARNIQGKGKNIQTLSAATTAGATVIVLTAAPSLTLLPGQQIVVGRATGTVEAAYVAFNYVPGTATVTVQTPLAQAHSAADTVEWDVFSPLGPGTNGFIATGMGIEEEALYDPASKQFFLAIGAGSDGNATTNTPIEVEGLYNGTTVDRARSVSAITDAYAGAGVGADAIMLFNGTNYDRLKGVGGSANVNLATLLAGEDFANNVLKTEQRFSYASINTATTTIVKTGSGFLHSFNILGGTLGSITVYDNTAASGTAIFPTFVPTSTLPSPTIIVDATFTTGLTIVTTAATVIQLSYR